MENDTTTTSQATMDSAEIISMSTKGDRGRIGEATPSLTIKQLWHASLKVPGQKMSLKSFAHKLVQDGDQLAKEWFANKKGAKNAERAAHNVKRVTEERQASKAAKKGKK